MTPIYATSTYVQRSPGEHQGFEYSRTQNPTRFALERCVADLESGHHGFAFASGVAASATLLDLLSPGDEIIASDDLYGGTYRLFSRVRSQSAGLAVRYVDLVDLSAVAGIARRHGIWTVADNTFASPWLQRPLEHGIDLVLHSTTKYLNGHSDMVGGMVVVGDNNELAERVRFLQNAVGAVAGPFDAFLALRGVKTLAVRMRQHEANAMAIAEYLSRHPKVRKVYYPGLPGHPQHALAKKQMRGFGGMMSFDLGSLDRARAFLDSVRLCFLGESLGGVESLICHPATMTHAYFSEQERQRLGITQGLVRLSTGIEDCEDIQADLDQALAKI
jgi:cystathionine gamma-lyase